MATGGEEASVDVESIVKDLEIRFKDWYKDMKKEKGKWKGSKKPKVSQHLLCQKLGALISKLESDHDKLAKDYVGPTRFEQLEQEKAILERRTQDAEKLKDMAESQVDATADYYKSYMSEKVRKIKELTQEVAQLKSELERAKNAKEEADTRLSEIAGMRLNKDNPNITDLSDQNRPTKIAEKFGELYCKEWTEAFEELAEKQNMSEEDAIAMLLETLVASYDSCTNMTMLQMDHLKSAVVAIEDQNDNNLRKPNEADDVITTETEENLHRLRKSVALTTLPYVKERIVSDLNERYEKMEHVFEILKPYAEKCGELCWLMCAQNPPVVLQYNGSNGEQFKTDIYTHYTKRGRFIKYVTWPALRLHKEGAIMSKGVAQGTDEEKRDIANVLGEND